MGNGEVHLSKSPQELLQEFRVSGREELFEEIVRRYAGMVFHTCLQVTRNSHDAEDVTQAVFLTLAVQCRTNKPIHCIGPWLQQVAHRLALDMRKSKKRRRRREETHGTEFNNRIEPDSSQKLNEHELTLLMQEEMGKLPAKYRMPLILHYFGGLSRDEMARELNCKSSTLGVRLFRGREMLGNRLAGRGITLVNGAMATALVGMVHRSMSDSMIWTTSHAAAELAASGEVSAGLISAQVLGLMRTAAKAVFYARLKLAVAAAMVAGSAMAAGAQVVTKVCPSLHFEWPNFGQFFNIPLRTNIAPLQSSKDTQPQAPQISVAVAQPAPAPIEVPFPAVSYPPQAPPILSGSFGTAPPPQIVAQPIPHELVLAPPAKASVAPVATPPAPLPLAGSAPAARSSHPAVAAPQLQLTSPPKATTTDYKLPADAISTLNTAEPIVLGLYQPKMLAQVFTTRPGTFPAAASTGSSKASTPGGGTIALSIDPLTIPGITSLTLRPVAESSPATDPAPIDVQVAHGPELNAALAASAMVYPGDTAHLEATTPAAPPTYAVAPDRIVGWGNVGVNGILENNGVVVADGKGSARTLDLSSVRLIRNSTSGDGGVNGWYARSGGRLLLPPVKIQPGATAASWGEEAGDVVPDLVNSVRMTFAPAKSGGAVEMALLSPDRDDVPALKGGPVFLNVWSIDTRGMALDDLRLAVRYDERKAAWMSPDGAELSLWRYDGNDWRLIDPTRQGVDPANHIIWANIGTDPMSLLAVTLSQPQDGIPAPMAGTFDSGFWQGNGDRPSAPAAPTAAVAPVNTPEPGCLLLIAAGAALLLRRRRSE